MTNAANSLNLTRKEMKILDQAEDGTISGSTPTIMKLISLGLVRHVEGRRESFPTIRNIISTREDSRPERSECGESFIYKIDDKLELTESGKVYNDELNANW